MSNPAVPDQILAAWWPCDRCAGSQPGVDAFGNDLPGPPVRLVGRDYLCGPCRKGLLRNALKSMFPTTLTPNERAQMERAKAAVFTGLRVRDEHGNFSTIGPAA